MITYIILGYLTILLLSWVFTFISIRKARTDIELWGRKAD